MRKAWFIALLLLALSAQAQVAQVWVSMPDSLCPYLNAQHRKVLWEQAARGVFDTIPNQLGGQSFITAIDKENNVLSVQLTQSMTMELTLQTDTIVLTETVCAPLCSTLTRRYNYAWMLLSETHSPWDAEQTDEEKEQLF